MFQGGVESTNDDAIDFLMGVKTPGADNLVGGKKKGADDGQGGDDNHDDDQNQEPDDHLEDDNEQPLPKRKAAKEPETAHDKVAKKTTDEVIDDLIGANDDDDQEEPINGKDKKKPAAAAPVKKAQPANTEVDYQAVYEAMVDDGVWGEVEVPEDFKWDAEGFKQIQALQVSTKYEDLLDKTGPYGKAIIEFEKNGGNPGEMLNLFREQRTVQEFNIESPEGQEEFLTSYLEAQGYSVKSIDRTIKALIDQGSDALKEEAEEKKALWDDQYKDEIEKTQKTQALAAKQLEDQVRNFNKNISESLTTDPELTPKERRELSNYILDYTQKFNGHDVSQFYTDMATIQKDPAAYVKLAKFIKGLKNGDYDKKIADKTKREVSAKTFLKVKNGNALSQRDGGQAPLNNAAEESSFVSYLTNRKK